MGQDYLHADSNTHLFTSSVVGVCIANTANGYK